MMQRSRAGWISLVAMFLSLGFVLAGVVKTLQSMSASYWPLLVIGLLGGVASTPSYYYFKSRDKQVKNPLETAVNALSNYAETPVTPPADNNKQEK